MNNSQNIGTWLGLILFVFGFVLNVAAAPADLDPSFGVGGKVVSNPTGTQFNESGSMGLQADGKIVMVVGNPVFNNSGSVNYIVARYNSDGSLDTTFGNGGWVTYGFGGTFEYPSEVEIQPDGKIVVGGTLILPGIGNAVGIIRLNPDGSLDPTFDGDGKLIADFDLNTSLGALKIANDGKIVIAGSFPGGGSDFSKFVGRLNTDGSFDTTFSGDGRLTDSSAGWHDLAILPDGSIIAAGAAAFSGQAAKYNSDGSKAWDFVPGNLVGIEFSAVVVQANGKFVFVGRRMNRIIAVRLNTNGTIDNTFRTDAPTPIGQVYSAAIQPDGKIVANIALDSSSGGFSVIRYNPDGTLDRGFGQSGVVRNLSGNGRKILLQPDGKILVGGNAFSPGTNFVIVRYLGGTTTVFRKSFFDFDGDGKDDISVFRPSENKWFILGSFRNGIAQPVFGVAGDIPVPADYDGDGLTDIAVFRPSTGEWRYLSSSRNGTQIVVNWGQAGDVPRPADFDNDGKTDFVVYRPSNSVWYRVSVATGETSITAFGIAEDKPLIGDFDGDGKFDLAVFRPSTGDWWYASSVLGGQFAVVHWGQTGDIPTPGDFDADGKTDFVVYRPSNGGWYILRSGEQNYTILQFGLAEDKPVVADYDGDGKADVAVFRPSTGTWYLLQTTAGFGAVQWGNSSDIPTEGAYLP